MASNPATKALTPIGTACFVDSLFKPKPRQEGSEKLAFSFILGFDKVGMNTQQYQDLRAAVAAAAADKWGAVKAADASFMRTLRLPFRNASEKDYAGFDQFEIYISPWSPGDKKAPEVVDLYGQALLPTDVWAGQLARATVRAFAYDNSGNKGVAFMLEHVQIVKQDCERIDGRVSADKAFAGADDSQLKALGIAPGGSGAKGSPSMSDDMPF